MSALSGALLFDFHRPKKSLCVTLRAEVIRISVPRKVAAYLIGGLSGDLGVDRHHCCVLPVGDAGLRFLSLQTDRASEDLFRWFGQILLAGSL